MHTFALKIDLELIVKKGWSSFGIVTNFDTCYFTGANSNYAAKPRIRYHLDDHQELIKSSKTEHYLKRATTVNM